MTTEPAHDGSHTLLGYAFQLAIPCLAMMVMVLGRDDAEPDSHLRPRWLGAMWAGPPLLLSLLAVLRHEQRIAGQSERDASGVAVIKPFGPKLPSGLEYIDSAGFADGGEIALVEPHGLRVLRPAVDLGSPPTLVVPAEIDLQRLVEVGAGKPFNLVTSRDMTLVLSDPSYEHAFEVAALGIRNAPIDLLTVRVEAGLPSGNHDQWCSSLPEGGLICGGQGRETMELHLGPATNWRDAPTMMASTSERRIYDFSVRAVGHADVRALSRFVRAIRVAMPAARRSGLLLATGPMSPTSALPSESLHPRTRVVASTSSPGTEIGALELYMKLATVLWICAPLFDAADEIALEFELRADGASVEGSKETRPLQDCLRDGWRNPVRPDRAAGTTLSLRISRIDQ